MIQEFNSSPTSIKVFTWLNCALIPLSLVIFVGKFNQLVSHGQTEMLKGRSLATMLATAGMVYLFFLMLNILVLKRQKIGRIIITLFYTSLIVFYFIKNYQIFLNGEILSFYNFLTFVFVCMMTGTLIFLHKRESKTFFDQFP